jgi:phage/plasmid-associated DNA primase
VWPLADAVRLASSDGEGVQAIVDHIKHGIANGDEEAAHYLIRWMAHILQKPYEKPKTAVILAGVQGTGKSLLMQMLARLLPPGTGMLTSSRELLFGRFTIHLMPLLFCGGEEVIYGGNHREDSSFKDAITCDTMSYEAKGLTPFIAKNYTRYMIASNSYRPISTEHGARRYLILEPSTRYAGDRDYWRRLAAWMEDHDTLAGFSRLLLDVDLSEWNPAHIPEAKGGHASLKEEITVASDPIRAYTRELIMRMLDGGRVLMGENHTWDPRTGTMREPHTYEPSLLYDEFRDWWRKNGHYGPNAPSFVIFMRQFKKLVNNESMKRLIRKDGDKSVAAGWLLDAEVAAHHYAHDAGAESWDELMGMDDVS